MLKWKYSKLGRDVRKKIAPAHPMSTLIPSLGAARFDARGELRLTVRLKDCLEDSAWVWHNIPVGPFGRHPDFVTLHPQQGIVVLEVKDWRLDTIANANSKQVKLTIVLTAFPLPLHPAFPYHAI